MSHNSAHRQPRNVRTRPASRPSTPEPDRALIERRAYELYLSRGGAQGDALQDWLEAERELQGARRAA